MKIFMIVDDSPVIRKVAKRIIEGFGFIVVEASTADEAQVLCHDNLPDAILIDWDMPGMDTIEFLRWLKDVPDSETVKSIYCTSEVLVPEMMKAKRAGAAGFLLKPFNRVGLAEKLRELDLLEEEFSAA